MRTVARPVLCAACLFMAAAAPSPDPTIVADPGALQRLQANSGMTLQWIGWDKSQRGQVMVTTADGIVHLSGALQDAKSTGRVTLDGDVLVVDTHSFTLNGHVAIADMPDIGRRCIHDGPLTFVAAGHRQYWRMHPYEGCGTAADYVDISFPDPTVPAAGPP